MYREIAWIVAFNSEGYDDHMIEQSKSALRGVGATEAELDAATLTVDLDDNGLVRRTFGCSIAALD